MKITKKHIVGFVIFDLIIIGVFLSWWFLFRVEAGNYRANVIELGLNFTAKNFCSCLFVAEQSEAACRDHVEIDQVQPKIVFDRDRKMAKASLLMFSAEAQFQGADKGCVLQQ